MTEGLSGPRQARGIPPISRKPLYFVIYEATGVTPGEYVPLVDASSPDYLQSATLPHLLDRDLLPTLPVIWYCLHLPATCFDLQGQPASVTKKLQGLDFSHEIFLTSFEKFQANAAGYADPICKPAIIFVADKHSDAIKEQHATLGWGAELIRFADLDVARLPDLWRRIADIMCRSAEYAAFNRVPPFCERLDVGPLMVPFRKLAHVRFPFPNVLPLPVSTDQAEQALDRALHVHTVLAATAALEEAKCDEAEAAERMGEEYDRQSHTLRLPASVALPGLPSAFITDRYPGRKHAEFFQDWHAFDPADTFARLQAGSLSDLAAERAALEIAVTHRACATTGLGMVLDPVSASLYGEVAQLERHYRSGANKPAYVWKTLEKIGQEMGQRLTPLQRSELARASQITAFTNFPLGWTLLPGDTSPLMCRVPLTYRPLLPLTRSLSSELDAPPIAYLGRSIRVLLAEALPVGDPIREASLEALKMIQGDLQFDSTITIKVQETPDVDALRNAIDSFRPAILLISSHGKHDLTQRTAGIEIGGQVCFGPELGQMPPVVILSTCHNAPRSTGAVNIAELLLRQGAMTVLGTQVPVNVYHNALLMVRFMVYIIESKRKSEPHRTLAEVWHRTAASNAINDIVDGDKKLKEWAHTPVNGTTPIQEFMHPKYPGVLRLGHIYKDSEARLLEIASRNKAGSPIEKMISSRNYVPETLFYLLLGWPERIRLNDPVLESMARAGKM